MKKIISHVLMIMIINLMIIQVIQVNTFAAASDVSLDVTAANSIVQVGDIVSISLVVNGASSLSDIYNVGTNPMGIGSLTLVLEYNPLGFSTYGAMIVGSENPLTSALPNLNFAANAIKATSDFSSTGMTTSSDSNGDNKITMLTFQFKAKAVGAYTFQTRESDPINDNTYFSILNDENTDFYNLSQTSITVDVVEPHSVTYSSNGADYGLVPTDSSLYISGAAVTVNGNTGGLAKTGKTFLGWSTTDAAITPTYTSGSSLSMPNSNLTLYAVWADQQITGIGIATPPTITTYIEGQTFSPAGIVVAAGYDNGTFGDVTASCTYSPTTSTALTTSVTQVAISCGGYTTYQAITVTAKALSSIAITTQPALTTYIEGQTFSPAGIGVTATYNDATTTDVTGSVTYNFGALSTVGSQTITATYTEGGVTKTATFNVTVNAKALSSIAITTQPALTTYLEGQTFNPAGIGVTATYDNGTTADVTGTVTYNFGTLNTTGSQIITATYTEGGVTMTATFNVTVNVKALSNIAITTVPAITTYLEGQTFNPAGIGVTATYDNGTTADVTGSVTYDFGTLSTVGSQTITATYTEGGVTKNATFNVTVNAKALSSIAITTPPTITTYLEGQTFSPAGIGVTATYDNGTTAVVTGSVTYNFGALNTVGSQTITATYTEGGVTKTATFNVTVNAKALSNIAITTQPALTTYLEGQTFNPAGIGVTATYDNGSTADVTGTVTFDFGTLSTVGSQTITATYTEGGVTMTATFNVTVNAKALSSIAITTQPALTTYLEGQTFSPAGIGVTATYDNGTTAVVTGLVTYNFGTLNTTGSQIITATYTEGGVTKTATFNVTVNAKALSSIAITTTPALITYIEGQALSTAGIGVTATYDNNTTADVTSSVTYDFGTLNTTGSQIITVSYLEGGVTKTATFNVTVNAKALSSIAITTQPAVTTYVEGQTLSTAGIGVTATYDNGTTAVVTSSVTYDFGTLNTTGSQIITASYLEGGVTKTATFNVNVTAKAISSIAITSQPAMTIYIEGQTFSPAGIQVTATYNDATTADVTGLVTYNFGTLNTVGSQTITATYTEGGVTKTATFNVTVNAKALSSIAITTTPALTTYLEGQTFSPAGIGVTATYDNGTAAVVTGSVTYNFGTLNTTGSQIITATYTEGGVTKTATFNVTVNAKALSNIAVITQPAKTSYVAGQTFSPAGIAVRATYDNGTTAVVTSSVTYDFGTLSTEGSQTITATYTEGGVTKTATFNVTVIAKALSSIAITTPPTKNSYIEGQTFSPAGIAVIATYNDASTVDVTGSVTYNATILSTVGALTITASYTDGVTMTAPISVTVTAKTISSIAVTTPPTKVSYIEGQTFSPTGILVTATYDNGTTGDVTALCTYSPTTSTALTTSMTQVVISCSGKTVNQAITVNAKTVSSIAITTQPTKTTYIEGQTFSPAGMVVTATYDNGTQEVITGYTVDTTTLNTVGTATVTVTFGGKQATLTVTVVDNAIYLSGLTINTGTLTPTFSAETLTYTVTVPNSASSIDVTPTLADLTSTMTITGAGVTNGSALTSGAVTTVNLSVGSNPITIVITASNNATNTYVLTVTRTASSGGSSSGSGGSSYTPPKATTPAITTGAVTSNTISFSSSDWNDLSKSDFAVVYTYDANGNEVIVPSSHYDEATGKIVYNATDQGTYYAKYNEVSFPDVSADHWANDYISYLAARGIISGDENGMFNPDAQLTRAQFVKILASMTDGLDVKKYNPTGFADVNSDQWYAYYIAWAEKEGIMKGYDGSSFGPNDMITREQMCVIVERYTKYLGYVLKNGSASTMKDSSSISSWAGEAVGAAQASGLVNGRQDSSFDPQEGSTRAESAAVVCRLLTATMKNMSNTKSVDIKN